MYALRNTEDSLSNYSWVNRGLNCTLPQFVFLDSIVRDSEPRDALSV